MNQKVTWKKLRIVFLLKAIDGQTAMRRVYGQTAQSRSSKSMKYKMNQFDKTALPFSQDGMVERFINNYL